MGVLQRFERRLGGLVEGAFAKVFKGGVEPVEIAGALARETDDRRAISSNRVLVPNEFAVELATPDYNRLSPYDHALCAELAEMVREHAAEQRYTFVGPVNVRLSEAPDLDVGVFRIRSSVASAEGMVATPRRRGPRAAPGEPRLLITNKEAPPGQEREYELTAESTLIGRSVECDIRLTDTGVSRRHGEIRRMPDGNWLYVDAGSTNGSIVNGRPATQAKLVNGDLIELGAALITFRRDDGRGGRDAREPGRNGSEGPEPFRRRERDPRGGPDGFRGGRAPERDRIPDRDRGYPRDIHPDPHDRPDPRDRPGPRDELMQDRLPGPGRAGWPAGGRPDDPHDDRSGPHNEPMPDRPSGPGRAGRPAGGRPDRPYNDRPDDRSSGRNEPYRDGPSGPQARSARPGPGAGRPDVRRSDPPGERPPARSLADRPVAPPPADRSGPRPMRDRDEARRDPSSARGESYREALVRAPRDGRGGRPRQDHDSDGYAGPAAGYGRRGDGSGPRPAEARRVGGRDADGRDGGPLEEIYDAETQLPGRGLGRPRPDDQRRRPSPPPPSDRSW